MQGFLVAGLIVLVKERRDEKEYGQGSECLYVRKQNFSREKYFHNSYANWVKLDVICNWLIHPSRVKISFLQCLVRRFCHNLVNKIMMISQYVRNKSEGVFVVCQIFMALAWLSSAKTFFEHCTLFCSAVFVIPGILDSCDPLNYLFPICIYICLAYVQIQKKITWVLAVDTLPRDPHFKYLPSGPYGLKISLTVLRAHFI